MTTTGPITIKYPDDDHLEVYVNGELVASADHDEHGWSGMDAVEKTAKAVGEALGSQLDDARRRLTAARLLVRRLVHMEREHLGSGRDGHLSERDLAPLLHALHIDPEETP